MSATCMLIVEDVMARHGVSMKQLKESRVPSVCRAREEAMARMRFNARETYRAIGEVFGGRDHSSVINAVSNYADRMPVRGNA